MTVDELLARCDLVRASEEKLSECKPFSCGEGDLDEFICTFAMPLKYLLVLKCSTKVSEKSDMAKSWAIFCYPGT